MAAVLLRQANGHTLQRRAGGSGPAGRRPPCAAGEDQGDAIPVWFRAYPAPLPPGPAAEHKGTADRVCLQHGGSVWALGAHLLDRGGAGRLPQGTPAPLFVPDKNPARYLELDHLALLPHESNFWYGSTVANMDAVGMYVMQGVNINSFWSMEPLLGPVDMAAAEGLPEWVILGAETGNRPGKVTPAREWVDNIVAFCEENEIPVFFKDNLRKYFPDLPTSAFPWEV